MNLKNDGKRGRGEKAGVHKGPGTVQGLTSF